MPRAWRRGRRTAGALALAVCALLLAACGGGDGGSSGAFAQGYRSVTAEYRSGLEQAQEQGRAARGASTADVLAVYGSVRDVTRAAATGYAGLAAPDDLADDFTRVRDAVQAQAEALDRVLSAAQGSDGAAVQAALMTYARAVADWGTARQQLEAGIAEDPARAGPA